MASSAESVSRADEPSSPAEDTKTSSDKPQAGESNKKTPSSKSSSPTESSAPTSDDGEGKPAQPQSSVDNGAEKSEDPGVDTAPPLPNEPMPEPEDDGWEAIRHEQLDAWYFYNRITGQTQWENPRVPGANGTPAGVASASATQLPTAPVTGGYNPAIHGDYDPNAWYAQGHKEDGDGGAQEGGTDANLVYVSGGFFNRVSGQFQHADQGPDRHSDEAKSRRQMNAFFDVDAAANAHDGRSLKAERSGKKPTKAELKAFKEKRRAKKEEKRRAWLRD